MFGKHWLKLLFLNWFAASGVLAAEPDIYNFVRHPDLQAVSLSADGHYFAALLPDGAEVEAGAGPENQRIHVWRVFGEENGNTALPYTREELNWLVWIGGGRLLMSLEENGLVLYDAHLKRLRPLIEGFMPRPGELAPALLAPLPDDPTQILMQWEDPAVPGYPAVYRVNAVEGTSEKIVGAWKPVVRWWASPEGEIFLGEGYRARRHMIYGRGPSGNWDRIIERDYFDDPRLSVIAVETGGATAIAISAEDTNTRAMWRVDTRTGDFLKRLSHDRRFDVTAAVLDPVTDMTVGSVVTRDMPDDILWSGRFKEQIMLAEQSIAMQAKERLLLIGASRDGRRQLYRIMTPYGQSRYVLADNENATYHTVVSPVKKASSAIQHNHYSVEGVWIPMPRKERRSGSAMHGILSVPKSGLTGKAIVYPHGGPVRRTNANYNALIAWLTANGYTVLQPNFRGSSGFGRAWRTAGYAEWGEDMQKDVRIAGDWLVEMDYAAPDKICALGGSYGGYAAVMGVIKDYDLFQCAVSLNGVMSLPMLIKNYQTKRFQHLFVPRVKGKMSERALRRRSPMNTAHKVRQPVLLIHGMLDTNVTPRHSILMKLAMEHAGKPVEFREINGAGHTLIRPSEKLLYYRRVIDFLDKHLVN